MEVVTTSESIKISEYVLWSAVLLPYGYRKDAAVRKDDGDAS